MPFHEVSRETIEELWASHVPKKNFESGSLRCWHCNDFWPCPIIRWMEDRPSRWIDRHRSGGL